MLDFLLRQALRLIQPVGFTWLVLIVLSVVLWRRRIRRPACVSGALVLLITLCGGTDLPGFLLRGLERPWAGVKIAELPACDAVIVLGGGTEPSRYEVGGMHLTKAGDRLIMGLELMRLGKAPVLLLGGGAATFEDGERIEADVVKTMLASWKLPATAQVESLGRSANTREEAEKVAALAKARGWNRVLIATSACHMRRTLGVFRTAGVGVVAAPCNFLTTVSTAPVPFRIGVPGWEGFEKISLWVHEKIGWAVYRRRGWIADGM